MKFLHNVTYIKFMKKDAISRAGIILLSTIYNPVGACVIGEVVGIGQNEKPIKAQHKLGDIVVFQKVAATGVPSWIEESIGANFKINNVDVAAVLEEDNVTPLDDYVLLKGFTGVQDIQYGLVLPEAFRTDKNRATVIRVGKNVKQLKPGDEVLVDLLMGSFLMTDEEYKITNKLSGTVVTCLIYKERSILAMKERN